PVPSACVHDVPNGASIETDAAGNTVVKVGGQIVATYPPCPCTHPMTMAGTGSVPLSGATPLSPFAFAHKYLEWGKKWGDPIASSEPLVSQMHIGLIRAGGYNNDANDPEVFDDAEVDTFIAYAKSVGAEPDIQVPILSAGGGALPDAQTAAKMVTHANVDQ